MASIVTEIISGMGCADFAAEILNREDAGFDVARVLAGFEEKQVGAAFDEAAGLFEIIFVKLIENVTPPVTLMAFVVGPIEPATKRGFEPFENWSHRLRRQFRGAAADLSGAIAESILGENEGRAAERICLDDVGAGFEVFAMNSENHIGSRDVEVFVAAFEMRRPRNPRRSGSPVAAWCPSRHPARGCARGEVREGRGPVESGSSFC